MTKQMFKQRFTGHNTELFPLSPTGPRDKSYIYNHLCWPGVRSSLRWGDVRKGSPVKQRELASPATDLCLTHGNKPGYAVHTEFAHCKTWIIKYLPRRNVIKQRLVNKGLWAKSSLWPVLLQRKEQRRDFKWLGEKKKSKVAIYFMTCENSTKFKRPRP